MRRADGGEGAMLPLPLDPDDPAPQPWAAGSGRCASPPSSPRTASPGAQVSPATPSPTSSPAPHAPAPAHAHRHRPRHGPRRRPGAAASRPLPALGEGVTTVSDWVRVRLPWWWGWAPERPGVPVENESDGVSGADGNTDGLAPEELRRCWAELQVWVSWFVDRYHLADEVPPCWPRHPALVDELNALWHYHQEVTTPFVADGPARPGGATRRTRRPERPRPRLLGVARGQVAVDPRAAARRVRLPRVPHRSPPRRRADHRDDATAFAEASRIIVDQLFADGRRRRDRPVNRHASSAWSPAAHDRSAPTARSASSCSPSATPPARGSTATGSSSRPPRLRPRRVLVPAPPSTSRATSPATASATGSASSPDRAWSIAPAPPPPEEAPADRHPRLSPGAPAGRARATGGDRDGERAPHLGAADHRPPPVCRC